MWVWRCWQNVGSSISFTGLVWTGSNWSVCRVLACVCMWCTSTWTHVKVYCSWNLGWLHVSVFFMKCHCLFMIIIDLFQTLLGCSLKYDILWRLYATMHNLESTHTNIKTLASSMHSVNPMFIRWHPQLWDDRHVPWEGPLMCVSAQPLLYHLFGLVFFFFKAAVV